MDNVNEVFNLLIKEHESTLKACERDDQVKINYSVKCSPEINDFFINIYIFKMQMLVKAYVFKVVKGELDGIIKLRKSYLALLDGTTLVGRFDIRMTAKYGNDEFRLAETAFDIEPLPPLLRGQNDFSGIVGTNYTNASAVNQIQFWLELNEVEIDRELSYAEDIGINSLRVFLHNYPYEQQPELFFSNIGRFLSIADNRGIRTILVFFDDCWYGDDRVFTFEPILGDHNGRWAKCPLIHERVVTNYGKFKSYIQNTIMYFKDDNRILAWEIWNEPKNCGTGNQIVDLEFTQDLMMNGFQWAREIAPLQPVISCWDGNVYGDIDDQHNYSREWQYSPGSVGNIPDEKRGTLVTEAGARIWGEERESNGSPIEWVHWLEERKTKGLTRPGVYLAWELMVGNSNCKWHWLSKPGDSEPPIPWCGLFYPEGTPVSIAETDAIRRYIKGESRCLYYSDFQDGTMKGWNVASGKWEVEMSGNVCELVANTETGRSLITAGSTLWKDYTVQAIVMLRKCTSGSAGVVVRTGGLSEGYFIGFNAYEIYISRIIDNDEVRLVSKKISNVRLNVRNSLKVTAKDNILSVYLNDPTSGIINYCDNQNAFPFGGIGLFTLDSQAVFDDIAVIPEVLL